MKKQYQTMAFRLVTLLAANFMLASCASLDVLKQKYFPQETIKSTKVAPQWQAVLPHDGNLADLEKFWQQYQDALLIELIAAAEAQSVDIAAAKSKIAQARADRMSAKSALLPTLDGRFAASRSVQQPDIKYSNLPSGFSNQAFSPTSGATNSAQIDAQAAWELDLFGANRGLLNSAKAREESAHAGWHDARVSLAA